ncbi:MAG: GntR family transcriptional regulator [Roseivivax sp.]|nr:GntR family transcriptional regulator [Roseivivax sp.]
MNSQNDFAAGLPAHELVYRQLRDMVLFGDLEPGQAVTIQGLTDLLQSGMTQVREARRRLTAEGALTFLGNRRITVPVLTIDDLDQLLLARRVMEPELARRACAAVTPEGIARLRAIDSQLDSAIDARDMHGYLRFNYAFHMEVYGWSGATILISVVDSLWLRFGPSLRGVLSTLGPRTPPDMHKALIEALEKGDAAAAAAAVDADIAQGMERLRLGLGD